MHSRFDLDDPATLEAGPGGGLLRDIGSHVVDQMLWLLGDVRSVNAHLDWLDLPDGRTDASFLIDLEHTSGVRSTVESSKANHLEARELRAYGSEGSYRALGTDVQAQAIFAGRRPVDDLEEWGYEEPGALGPAGHGRRRGVGAVGAGPLPRLLHRVRCCRAWRGHGSRCRRAEGIRTLAVLDAARLSAESGESVRVPVGTPIAG